MRRLLRATPFRAGQTPLRVVPNLEKTLFDYYYRGAYDDYWAQEYNDFERFFFVTATFPARSPAAGSISSRWP